MSKIRISITLIIVLFPFTFSYSLQGETEPFPGRVYVYMYNPPTGITRGLTPITWEIENGKIRDANGNFTLTSLTQPDWKVGDKVYVIWDDENGKNRHGSLKFGNVDWINVYFRVGQLTVENENYNFSSSVEGTYLTLKNIVIGTQADVVFNGYKSVHILPGFTTELGCKVRICNDQHLDDPIYPSFRESTRSKEDDAQLYQTNTNSSDKLLALPYYIPEGSVNAQIYIYNSFGNIMMKKNVDFIGKSNEYVDTAGWPNGVYLYSLVVDGRIIDTKRMIVSN